MAKKITSTHIWMFIIITIYLAIAIDADAWTIPLTTQEALPSGVQGVSRQSGPVTVGNTLA